MNPLYPQPPSPQGKPITEALTSSSRKTQELITTLLSNIGESELTLTKLAVTLGSALLPSGQWILH